MDHELVVRQCTAADATALAEMYAHDRNELEASDPPAPSFFEAAGQLERITRVWPEYQTVGFVVLEHGRIIGLFVVEDAIRESATLGYYVLSAHRGRGVASRALAQVAVVAFRDLGLRRLVADIRPDNRASLRVAARNGFRDEGAIVIDGLEHRRLVLAADPLATE